jgi:hypothetical protein
MYYSCDVKAAGPDELLGLVRQVGHLTDQIKMVSYQWSRWYSIKAAYYKQQTMLPCFDRRIMTTRTQVKHAGVWTGRQLGCH